MRHIAWFVAGVYLYIIIRTIRGSPPVSGRCNQHPAPQKSDLD